MRRNAWAVAAAAFVASVAGAVLAPSSWWAATGVVAFVVAMTLVRPRVPERYRAEWPRAVIILSLGMALGGASYAFAVEPLGPKQGVAMALGSILATAAAVTVGGTLTARRTSPSDLLLQDEIREVNRQRAHDVRRHRY